MNDLEPVQTDTRWILSKRPPKNQIDSKRPYAFFVEKERTAAGGVEDVATIFLTNRECPFHCLMCDLWRNTTDAQVADGEILEQIQWASERLIPVKHAKLYNSGNFFDAQAIPPADIPQIAEFFSSYRSLLIENHPRLVDRRCLEFQDKTAADLQVAMGLETVHPKVLEKLNKQMTLTDFKRAAHFLTKHNILVRAFILLKPPFLSESEGVKWARHSLEFAFEAGVECCVIIPTRAGNGALDSLQKIGMFSPPMIQSLEESVEYGVQLKAGRVFADLWDIEKFASCIDCCSQRVQRLSTINLTQKIPPPVRCARCSST